MAGRLRFLLAAALALPLLACTGGESGVEGQLLFQDRPLSGAQVEVYLRSGRDRSTSPFAVTGSDDEGRYRLDLPPGSYFLIAKKKETAGGRTRMLMAECPANPIAVENGRRKVPSFSLREMGREGGLIPDPGTGVAGRITGPGGEPLDGAYVYVYTEASAGLMGPSYGEAVRSAEDGTFRLDLPAGSYYLAARKRSDGSRLGEPRPGDLNAGYSGNPVQLEKGEVLALGDFRLDPVDAETRTERLAQGKFLATETRFEGRVVDPDGRPVPGVFVFAYLDSRMVGKPTYISAPSGEGGGFSLSLGAGGTYYLGARSGFGGPLEPGEWVGTYEGRPDHGIEIERGARVDLGELTVRETW